MTRPVFKPHLQVSVIPGEGVLVLFEEQAWALHGEVYELLVPLMDGSRDADALVEALAGKVDGAAGGDRGNPIQAGAGACRGGGGWRPLTEGARGPWDGSCRGGDGRFRGGGDRRLPPAGTGRFECRRARSRPPLVAGQAGRP